MYYFLWACAFEDNKCGMNEQCFEKVTATLDREVRHQRTRRQRNTWKTYLFSSYLNVIKLARRKKLQDFLLPAERPTLLFGFFKTLTEEFFECRLRVNTKELIIYQTLLLFSKIGIIDIQESSMSNIRYDLQIMVQFAAVLQGIYLVQMHP